MGAIKFVVPVGQGVEPVVFSSRMNIPMTLAAIPGSGGTLLIEYQVARGGHWFEWPDGVVSAPTLAVVDGPLHALRFTAATAEGVVEMNQWDGD